MVRTPFLLCAASIVAWFIQSQVNHYLAGWQLSVFVGGLIVAFAALRLTYRDGSRGLVLAGLWFDAASPVPFGAHVFVFLFAQTIIFSVRDRLAREETLVGIAMAALANLLIIVSVSALLLHRNPAPFQLVGRLIADSLVSFCLVVLVASWFFAFAEHLLEIGGVSLRREQRNIG